MVMTHIRHITSFMHDSSRVVTAVSATSGVLKDAVGVVGRANFLGRSMSGVVDRGPSECWYGRHHFGNYSSYFRKSLFLFLFARLCCLFPIYEIKVWQRGIDGAQYRRHERLSRVS